jgi:hypothetical protein
VLKAKISISSTYFSAVETMIDFFQQNRPIAACREGLQAQFSADHGYEA